MKIEIRSEGVAHISGYVNVPGRWSRPMRFGGRKVKERIKPGAFEEAIKRARETGADIYVMADHDASRKLASMSKGSLRIKEDAIGLFAEADITEKRAVERAKKGEIKGWSFGFYPLEDEYCERSEYTERTVKSLKLTEISLIYDASPCYEATSVEVRGTKADGEENKSYDIRNGCNEVGIEIIEVKGASEERADEKKQEADGEEQTGEGLNDVYLRRIEMYKKIL